jgi:hypothetical protein
VLEAFMRRFFVIALVVAGVSACSLYFEDSSSKHHGPDAGEDPFDGGSGVFPDAAIFDGGSGSGHDGGGGSGDAGSGCGSGDAGVFPDAGWVPDAMVNSDGGFGGDGGY